MLRPWPTRYGWRKLAKVVFQCQLSFSISSSTKLCKKSYCLIVVIISIISIFNFTPSYKNHPQYLYFISLWPSCHLQEHGPNISSSESRDRNFVSEAKVCPALHHRLALSLSFTLMFEINLPLSSIKSWVFIFRNIYLYDHLMNVNWGTKLKRDPLTLTNFLVYLFK